MDFRQLRLRVSQWLFSILETESYSTDESLDPFDNKPYASFTPLFNCDRLGDYPYKFSCASKAGNSCTVATFDYGNTGRSYKPGQDQTILELAEFRNSSESSIEPATVTVTVTATATPTGILADAASRNAQPSPSVSATSNDMSTSTTIGLGIGIPIGVFALGLLGYLFYRQRSINKNIAIQAAAMEPTSLVRRTSSSFYGSQSPYAETAKSPFGPPQEKPAISEKSPHEVAA